MCRKGQMMKTILTMEDLIQYCEMKNLQSFSSAESGFQLAVQVPSQFEVEDDDNMGMMKLKFKVFHTGLNRNGSFVSKESADKAMNTIANRPILAHIHQLDNGEWDFEAHNMEEVVNENGEKEIRYIESQVGSFSSEPTFWEHDDENDKDFVCAYGYIPREYTKAAEIIERKNGTKNSCELFINKMSYNAKEKYLELEDFYVSGSTLLGSRADGTEIGEGMQGSRADIVDFKAEPQTFETNSKLIEALENLNQTLSHFNKQILGKEVDEVKKEDLEQKQATIEEFDLTDGAETGETGETGETNGETGETQTTGTETTGGTEASGETPATNGTTEGTNDGDSDTTVIIDDDETAESKKIAYTIEMPDGTKKEFGLSVSEKMRAIYSLVNATYGEEDWYDVEMYEDDGYIEMYGWCTGKNYRQKYEEADGNFSLTGDRIEIFEMFVTAEQKAQLEQAKTEFAETKEKLRKYEEEPQKMEILNSEDYSKVFSTKEFEELKLQETHFDMSIDEVKAKADSILLDYAKHSNFSLTTDNDAPKAHFVKIPTITKRPNRYGTVFSGGAQDNVK